MHHHMLHHRCFTVPDTTQHATAPGCFEPWAPLSAAAAVAAAPGPQRLLPRLLPAAQARPQGQLLHAQRSALLPAVAARPAASALREATHATQPRRCPPPSARSSPAGAAPAAELCRGLGGPEQCRRSKVTSRKSDSLRGQGQANSHIHSSSNCGRTDTYCQ